MTRKKTAPGNPKADPLDALLAFDRLEVGPVVLARDGLTAPYRIARGGEEAQAEIAYRFEEDVFDPAAEADLNLGSMIAAQAALNYGLFCRELVFRGPFDAADRRFLTEMSANTNREIFVNKILAPNPFLRPEAQGLPAVRRADWGRAALVFDPSEPASLGGGWSVDPERYAVLSSGGKDSLLSWGLLAELGCEAHPIFLNESGRHWFTALNAYRHFAAEVETTARVWTSSDRLFNAMLRHLPFVRSDFARLRADGYPIRLWTVAVFLFGALPLLRKRGLGRLVVGDEFDTTVRARHHGIPHYDGLYDQSRWFDEAMSRYFARKGWGVTQLSLLRPCSELLIEKTLAERYPHLLALQVSCHAAHTDDEKVRPCGRCEKCRRIAGMLAAIGADPGLCGYEPDQVERLLDDLVERGVHQETPGAGRLAWLLAGKGLLAEPRLGKVRARRRPEVAALRFHPEKSPFAGLPVKLRAPLYGLLGEHAEGVVKRVGRQWLPVDLANEPDLAAPYPFDRPRETSRSAAESSESEASEAEASAAGRERGPRAASGGGGEGFLWGEMTWPEAGRRLEGVDVALLPVGAVEQHGPHLPLDTDAFDADYLARRVAAACSDPKPLVLPLLPYGVSYHHDDFKGTLSIGNETLSRLVYEVGMSAARNGISKLVIVNGHGGNGPSLHFAAQMINRDAHIFTCVDSGETSDADIEALAETPNDVHAGEIETSTTLAVRPELVKMEEAVESVPSFSSRYLDFSSSRSVGWYARTAKISSSGVMGDASKATAAKGERIWKVMIENLAELVEHLKSLTLEEIHQRRY